MLPNFSIYLEFSELQSHQDDVETICQMLVKSPVVKIKNERDFHSIVGGLLNIFFEILRYVWAEIFTFLGMTELLEKIIF